MPKQRIRVDMKWDEALQEFRPYKEGTNEPITNFDNLVYGTDANAKADNANESVKTLEDSDGSELEWKDGKIKKKGGLLDPTLKLRPRKNAIVKAYATVRT